MRKVNHGELGHNMCQSRLCKNTCAKGTYCCTECIDYDSEKERKKWEQDFGHNAEKEFLKRFDRDVESG